VTSWSVRTSHARLLLCIARDPGVRLRDIAAGPGSTERSAYGIVTDLTTAGYAAKQKDGRNRYQRLRPRTSRRSWRVTDIPGGSRRAHWAAPAPVSAIPTAACPSPVNGGHPHGALPRTRVADCAVICVQLDPVRHRPTAWTKLRMIAVP
jgi:hypothetical protein